MLTPDRNEGQSMSKTIEIRYSEESGCWHLFLIGFATGEVDLASFCGKQEAVDAEKWIREWAEA